MFGSGARPLNLAKRATLTISNEELNDIMKTIKSFEESGLLIKGVSKTMKNEAKRKKPGFSSMLLGTLSGRLLGNLLTCKGTNRAGKKTIRADEGTIRACQDF